MQLKASYKLGVRVLPSFIVTRTRTSYRFMWTW